MAAAQGLAAKMDLTSFKGLTFSPLNSRVCVLNSLEVGGKCVRVYSNKVSKLRSRKPFVSMCLNGSNSNSGFVANTTTKYAEEKLDLIDDPVNANSVEESVNGKVDGNTHVQAPPKRTAKIHDFCLGIPFGGIVFAGGLVGFLFTRNAASLTTGVLLGGIIMALGVLSLKVWKTGKSSLPFILGQAVIAGILLRKNLHSYSLTKKLFPAGFSIFLSAAMICFYSYVVLSGGNPPSKKLATGSQN